MSLTFISGRDDVDDVLVGSAEDEYISGSGGSDTLNGTAGKDGLDGGDGNDIYIVTASSGAGSYLFDLSGMDILTFTDASPRLVRLTAGAMGFDRAYTALYIDLNKNGELDSADLSISSFFADSIENAPGFGFIETIGSFSGTDILALDFTKPAVVGTERDDTIIGTAENNSFWGFGGNDTLIGGAGNDMIMGGDGNDTISGGDGDDAVLTGSAGDDTINGGSGNDVITGNEGNDIINGDEGDDSLSGDAGNDTINGGTGRNYLDGGEGDDTYLVTASGGGGSYLYDASGNDALQFTDASPALTSLTPGMMGFSRVGHSIDLWIDFNQNGEIDFVTNGATIVSQDLKIHNFFADPHTNTPGSGFIETIGNLSDADILAIDFPVYFLRIGDTGNNTLTGESSNDTLIGGAGDDRLDGGAGNDSISGGTEADLLVGGTGTDRLTGGAGADDFQFGGASRSRVRPTGRMSIDRITDFERGQDSIVLSKSTFNNVKRSDFKSVKTIAQARNSKAEITYIQKTGALFYNQNGAAKGFGSGGQFADLTDGLAIRAGDFSIVS